MADDPPVSAGERTTPGMGHANLLRRRQWIVTAIVVGVAALALAGGLVAHASSSSSCHRVTALGTTRLVPPSSVPKHLPASHDNDAGWSRNPDAYPDADVDRYQLVPACP